jgi:hypothetical protein
VDEQLGPWQPLLEDVQRLPHLAKGGRAKPIITGTVHIINFTPGSQYPARPLKKAQLISLHNE